MQNTNGASASGANASASAIETKRTIMNSLVGLMPSYNARQHVLTDWLTQLEQRFELEEVTDARKKITWCRILIGQTGGDILAKLPADATWNDAKKSLLDRLGEGSVEEEAWQALKGLKRNGRDIVDLAAEAEKLAHRLHPNDETAAERQAIEALISALDTSLAVEVQKQGHRRLADVIAAARRIEKINKEHPSPGMDRFVTAMQEELRAVQKELKMATDKMAAVTASSANAAATAMAATALPPASALPPPVQHPLPPPGIQPYHYGSMEYAQRQPPAPRRHRRCFLCDEEGHFLYNCPAKQELQRLLRQQPRGAPRPPPRGRMVELPAPGDGPGDPREVHLN